ncbi:MAG: MBL fold metallo-hydrolase [Oscillospiraceae bacterium]|nr:MBL fold metallo-hydrolase [Oscillospiraceae bacterium]
MKIKFLGTSAAYSNPLPFCNCILCAKARKSGGKDLRKRASLLINENLLIDMNEDLASASYMHNVDTTKIRHWLQTHSHFDHFSPGHLITRMDEFATQNIQPLSLYASSKCIQRMSEKAGKTAWDGVNLFAPEWQSRLSLNVTGVNHGEEFKCGRYLVTALYSAHDVNDGSYLWLVNDNSRRLFYGIDADEKSLREDTLKYLSDNGISLDVVVLDHTYGQVKANDHLNTDSFIAAIQEMKKRHIINDGTKIFASHISHEGTLPHDEFAAFSKQHGYDIAFDGLELEV